jgi:predicted CXXCH cytochrome family protein
MHRMTRLIEGADVKAPFAGETLHFKDDAATLEKKGAARYVRLTGGAGAPPRYYRVTRVIGGHHREDFAGVAVSGEDAAPLPGFDRGDELILPVSYLIGPGRLRYKGYSVLVHERSVLEPGPVWNRTCLLCHNTAPYLESLFGALAGPKPAHYQGEVVDGLLDGPHAFHYVVTDAPRLASAAAAEVRRASGAPLDEGGTTERVLRRAVEATRDRLTGSGLLEVGIGCESCHGGCSEHVRHPDAIVPTFEPVAPFLAVRKVGGGEPTGAELENHACARCHQVLFSRYPFTWEGGKRYAMPGGSPINSGEGRDFLLGACSGAMSCTACHDPHATDERAHLAELATPAGNRVCVGCHAKLRQEAALAGHAHHDPKGPGGSCIACHMPKKNLSLDTALTRYHRIGSPTDPGRVLNDRPLECATCHADMSVSALTVAMQSFWHKAYDADQLHALYGDGGTNVLLATLERGKPHEKAAALAMLGDRPQRELAPVIAKELANEYPLVREYAALALTRAIGPCSLSLYASSEKLKADAEACLRAAVLPAPTWSQRAVSTSGTAEPVED